MICYIIISSISGYTIILDDKIVCTKRHIFLVSCQFEMDTYLIGDKGVMQRCTIIYHAFEGHLKKYATHRRSTQLER